MFELPKVDFTLGKIFNLVFLPLKRKCYVIDRNRVSVQEVKSLGGHFACLCREFEIYEVKKNGNTFFTLLIIFILKSLQKSKIAQIYSSN